MTLNTNDFVVSSDFCTCCGQQVEITCPACQATTFWFGDAELGRLISWAEEHECK